MCAAQTTRGVTLSFASTLFVRQLLHTPADLSVCRVVIIELLPVYITTLAKPSSLPAVQSTWSDALHCLNSLTARKLQHTLSQPSHPACVQRSRPGVYCFSVQNFSPTDSSNLHHTTLSIYQATMTKHHPGHLTAPAEPSCSRAAQPTGSVALYCPNLAVRLTAPAYANNLVCMLY